MAEFTKGPWDVEMIGYSRGEDASIEIWGTDGNRRFLVCQTIMREIETERDLLDKDEANARLIAAAPELLETLEKILTLEPRSFRDPWDFVREVDRLAEAAIRKAQEQ